MDWQQRSLRAVDTFLVERYWPGVTRATFIEASRRIGECVESLSTDGVAIQMRSSTLVPVDEAAYWVIEAASTEIVQAVSACAGVPFERIVVAVEAAEPAEVPAGP